MEFCTAQDTYGFVKKSTPGFRMGVEEFYCYAMRSQSIKRDGSASFQMDLLAELHWWRNRRPYYNVWPSMTDALLDFDISAIPFQSLFNSRYRHVSIQFPVGGVRETMCIGVSLFLDGEITGIRGGNVLVMTKQSTEWSDLGKGIEYKTRTSMMMVPSEKSGLSMAECISQAADIGSHKDKRIDFYSQSEFSDVHAVSIAVLLMEQDPDLFEPDILSKDVDRYQNGTDEEKERLVEKAFNRRGRPGWHVGRKLESIPHFRRPHLALYWTEKGRKTARIIMRKGCIVKREKLTKVPTGFHGDEKTESQIN